MTTNEHGFETASILPRADLMAPGFGESPHRCAVLAIDGSQSMDEQDWLPSRRAAAFASGLGYVDALAAASSANEVAFVLFDEQARLVCPLTACSRRKEIEQCLDTPRVRNRTNIAAALRVAGQVLAHRAHSGAELVVHLLTDGHHNFGEDPRPIAHTLKQNGVTIDVVGIGGDPAAVGENLLSSIASRDNDGRPRYRFIGTPQRLTLHYRRLAGRLTL
jgi:Mg-chelatase subunit ChlD